MADGVFRDHVTPRLERLAEGLYDQELLNRLGLAVIRRVRERTRRGESVTGSPFQPYSRAYARLKDRADGTSSEKVTLEYGVRREGKGEEARIVVNKYDTMLTHLDHVAALDGRNVVVWFKQERAERIARYHHQEGAGKSKVLRPFFAINEDDQTEISDIVQEHIDELLSMRLEN